MATSRAALSDPTASSTAPTPPRPSTAAAPAAPIASATEQPRGRSPTAHLPLSGGGSRPWPFSVALAAPRRQKRRGDSLTWTRRECAVLVEAQATQRGSHPRSVDRRSPVGATASPAVPRARWRLIVGRGPGWDAKQRVRARGDRGVTIWRWLTLPCDERFELRELDWSKSNRRSRPRDLYRGARYRTQNATTAYCSAAATITSR
jgi:hypothetical protein